MGEIPNNSRSRKGTSDYFVNEDGSVTKKEPLNLAHKQRLLLLTKTVV